MVVKYVHIGPPKSASTWLYRCMESHPKILVPSTDSSKWFSNQKQNQKIPSAQDNVMDFDQDYLTDPDAPSLMYEHNPKIDVAVTLRDPIERAFSHYWHEKKKGVIDYEFSDVLQNYSLYRVWLVTGFYVEHLNRYLDFFPREQLHIFWFSDLKEDNEAFLHRVQDELGISRHTPSFVSQKINEADTRRNVGARAISQVGSMMEQVGLEKFALWLKSVGIGKKLKSFVSDKSEYDRGVPPELRERLLSIMIPKINELEDLTGEDLSDWKVNVPNSNSA